MKSKGIQRVIFDQNIPANSNLLRAEHSPLWLCPASRPHCCIVFVTGTTIHTNSTTCHLLTVAIRFKRRAGSGCFVAVRFDDVA